MSVFCLQIIAMVTMLIDHIGFRFFPDLVVLRCIGRFSFPIYAFLLAEGFLHFKDDPARVKKHFGFLCVTALVSEFGYDLMEYGLDISRYATEQSVIVTFLLAMLGLMAIEIWKDKPYYIAAAVAVTAGLNFVTYSNYKFTGVLLVYMFYVYLKHKDNLSYIKRVIFIAIIFILFIPVYHWARFNFCDWTTYVEQFNTYSIWYVMYFLVALLLPFYNGKLGYHSKGYKTFYHIFYPAHLICIGLINMLI